MESSRRHRPQRIPSGGVRLARAILSAGLIAASGTASAALLGIQPGGGVGQPNDMSANSTIDMTYDASGATGKLTFSNASSANWKSNNLNTPITITNYLIEFTGINKSAGATGSQHSTGTLGGTILIEGYGPNPSTTNPNGITSFGSTGSSAIIVSGNLTDLGFFGESDGFGGYRLTLDALFDITGGESQLGFVSGLLGSLIFNVNNVSLPLGCVSEFTSGNPFNCDAGFSSTNDVTVNHIAGVVTAPEPGTLALALIGGIGVMWRRVSSESTTPA